MQNLLCVATEIKSKKIREIKVKKQIPKLIVFCNDTDTESVLSLSHTHTHSYMYIFRVMRHRKRRDGAVGSVPAGAT